MMFMIVSSSTLESKIKIIILQQQFTTINRQQKPTVSQMSTYKCDHDYCPHLHFKKCMNARLQSIPYTIFPDATIDSFTNVPTRSANLYKSNIPTVAYQNYTIEQSSNKDTNFAKNYYYSKDAQQTGDPCLCNDIVKELEEDMATRSAYVLAGVETKKYEEWERKRKADIENARNRAIARYNDHFKAEQDRLQAQKQQNEKWLKKLYRKLEEVARHIIEGQGETLGQRQRKFLLSKANLTANYLGQIKVRDPKKAFQILQQLRTLMLKKKLRFEQQRQQQQHNKSVSMTFTSESGSQNTSQNSMMSQATSVNDSKALGEDKIVGKYCDFQALKKKWKCEDIEEVKEIIRRVLTKDMVSQAEVQAVRKRKQAQKNNQNIRKKNTPIKNKRGDSARKTAASLTQQDLKKRILPVKTTLSGPQQGVKSALLKGGQFDAAGQKFQRTRNYSQMFRRREQQNLVDFQIKEKTLSFSRDCCCPAN